MLQRKERNCQIRMSSSLWNLVGEISQELGYKDARGRHSAVIREMIAAAAAKWTHSPYICRSAHHTFYVTAEGMVFVRQVEVLRLNASRERLPCSVEMKPEKREYYHQKYQDQKDREDGVRDEHNFFLSQWLLNHFAVWNGKKQADDIESFQSPLSSQVDKVGTNYKSADLHVHAVGGRFLTRETILGLRDYVQWKEPDTPKKPETQIFDRVGIPIDIPTSDLEVCVVVDQDLFASMDIDQDEIANLALEFRNLESARFEGKEVALYPEIALEEQFGRSPSDEGADESIRKIRRLRQRIFTVLGSRTTEGDQVAEPADKDLMTSSLKQMPRDFLFYGLRWRSPHLGIVTCVRWEKPVRKGEGLSDRGHPPGGAAGRGGRGSGPKRA